jgi:transposase
MNPKTIAIDLAKDVFEVALANEQGRITGRERLKRPDFANFMANQPPAVVVMEACGTAHFWGRMFSAWGHEVRLLPAHYVRPYRRRNKTDRADTEALLEAHRCEGIMPVPVKSVDQQQMQHLHRLREQWKTTRTARINLVRGTLREFGILIAQGTTAFAHNIASLLEKEEVPSALRQALQSTVDEIAALELRIRAIEKQLSQLTRDNEAVARLQQISGIGLLTSTALVAAAGSPNHFKSGRHLAAWVGLTPRESSSGNRRHLGRINKQGDCYLRMLFIHGARSVLARSKQLQRTGNKLPGRLAQWAVDLERRVGHNKATVALANKLVRIAWACWRNNSDFNPNHAAPIAA